ncbi:MAG: ABC transporter permease [Deltaproteobacteria bacterium]|nr:ABC transporter permease [Deltaproteobacteria bacterium]
MANVEQTNTEAKVDSASYRVGVLRSANDTLVLKLSGRWKLGSDIPSPEKVQKHLGSAAAFRRIVFHTKEITGWDSTLVIFLKKIVSQCASNGVQVDGAGLPEGVQRLLELASAIPEKKDARKETQRQPFLAVVGESTLAFLRSTREMIEFVGELSVAFGKLVTGKARFRRSDLLLIVQQSGAQALPIVSLISMLVGLILAFVGAVQLEIFGAQIYVASIVGIAMVRVMGAIMTGIIMAGRTGAAFAAELGTMTVNEEIDALKTLGVSPMEFLVLPRILALILMMPLLCLYADLMGVLGGLIVGVGMLDLGVIEYYNMTKASVGLNDLWIGLFHSAVFGVLVAVSGCLRGMQCGRSASAVGDAATSAVVTGIVSIIVATAIITVICNVLGL